jgi:hypothetical protein
MMARNTPAAIARQLRQEAGFGCCLCGNPILQYHHIVQWADDQHFRAEDMMVLCPLHHDQVTKGAMPEAEQRQFKANPKNIERGFANGLLAVKQDYCAADLGSVTVVGEGTFLEIDGQPILGFNLGNNNLEISLSLFDEQDKLLLEIDRNEWISGDPMPWDIEADWQTLTIRERARRISVSIDGKSVPLEIRGELWKSGKQVQIGKDVILVSHIKSGFQELALVGMKITIDTAGMKFGPKDTEIGGMIVSWPNRRERLWKAKEAWKKLQAKKVAPN